jgi:hypothetical protein
MAAEKEGGRTRRKTNAGRDDGKQAGRTVEKASGPARDMPMVDIDPWGSFFERFWGQAAEGESADADRHDGGQKPAKDVRAPGAKPGRQGRSPRAS